MRLSVFDDASHILFVNQVIYERLVRTHKKNKQFTD
jgi:hypothetical protein